MNTFQPFQNENARREHNETFNDIEEVRKRFPFQLDCERIVRCKAFRRLKHKTQFFLSPKNDLYRTRITHTIEAAQIGKTLSNALGLNADLTEAIVLAHDLGHPPFGHAGERGLATAMSKHTNGAQTFDHNLQSYRTATKIEKLQGKEFRGLNLTLQVLDALKSHDSLGETMTNESIVASLTDDITYLNHDFEDLVSSGYLLQNPTNFTTRLHKLGKTHEERLTAFLDDVVHTSKEMNKVCLSEDLAQELKSLRQLIKDEILTDPHFAHKEREAERIVIELFDLLMDGKNVRLLKHLQEKGDYISEKTLDKLVRGDKLATTLDYVARMTDTFALEVHRLVFSPQTLPYHF